MKLFGKSRFSERIQKRFDPRRQCAIKLVGGQSYTEPGLNFQKMLRSFLGLVDLAKADQGGDKLRVEEAEAWVALNRESRRLHRLVVLALCEVGKRKRTMRCVTEWIKRAEPKRQLGALDC